MQAADNLSNATITNETIRVTVSLTMQLVNITEPRDMSLFPSALDATNEVTNVVLDVLEEIRSQNNTQMQTVEEAGTVRHCMHNIM